MAGVFEGLRVLDLSWGVAGPIATMFLADHGADVVRVERPQGAPFEEPHAYRVWNRGKRSAVLDLRQRDDRATFLALAARSDVVVESFEPGTAARLGVDYETLAVSHPSLVYCSITGYGPDTRYAGRPGYDQLVAARTGHQWEARGWYGSPMDHIQGKDADQPDFAPPDSVRIGSDRNGPVFTATPQASIGAAHLASIGIASSLYVRERHGVGQHVETSLLQGLLYYNACTWQRPERLDAPGYQLPMLDRRQNWGLMEVADGWICMWGAPPAWPILAAEGNDVLQAPDPGALAAMAGGGRGMAGLRERLDGLAQAAPHLKRFTRREWDELATSVGFNLQPVRTPEEALTDPLLLADGSVVEIEDPDVGPIRAAGVLFRLRDRPTVPRGPAPRRGQHTEQVRRDACADGERPRREPRGRMPGRGPLDGVRVLDFGFAVAGPFTSQVLADLGADVIKVDTAARGAWGSNHMGMGVNKSKRHLALDAKHPDARPVLEELIRSADVLTHNMRPGAAERLGLDYSTVSTINPRLIYLHTRAHEDGPRSDRGGHDQSANALGGTEWEDGGCWDGGRPYFSVATGGDLGNGLLGASAVVYALYDRERTGAGQLVDTSILNSALLCCSRIYTNPQGDRLDLPRLDAQQLGFSALYRLYECASGWLCVAILGEAHWSALLSVMPHLADDERFASAQRRARNDASLVAVLEATFRGRTAEQWFEALDAAGVPCEVSDPTWSKRVFDDPELLARQWVVHCAGHPVVGDIDMVGVGIDFSRTPATAGGPPPTAGQHTAEILMSLGYTAADIVKLQECGAVHVAGS